MTMVAKKPCYGAASVVQWLHVWTRWRSAMLRNEWERFERQLRSAGYCRHPVRLRGQVDGLNVLGSGSDGTRTRDLRRDRPAL
jgi:hypothetical protein